MGVAVGLWAKPPSWQKVPACVQEHQERHLSEGHNLAHSTTWTVSKARSSVGPELQVQQMHLLPSLEGAKRKPVPGRAFLLSGTHGQRAGSDRRMPRLGP